MTNNNLLTTQEEPTNSVDIPLTERSEHSALDSITVYCGATVIHRESSPMRPYRLPEIIEAIKSNDELAAIVQQVRGAKSEDERNEIKKHQLPYITLGKFKKNHLSKENLLNIEYPIFDLDDLDENLDSVRNDLIKDPYTFMLFTSPSGNGLKLVCQFDIQVTDVDMYRILYKHHSRKLQKRYGIQFDPKTHDASRACFLSHDPNFFVNINRKKLPTKIPDLVLEQKRIRTKEASEFAFGGTSEGSRDSSATALIGKFISMGHTEEYAIEMFKLWNLQNVPPMSEQEIVQKVGDQYKRWKTRYLHLPTTFSIIENCYVKKVNKENRTISTFIIRPKELLELDDKDCLKCDVVSHMGSVYKDILIENTDWHSKSKLLKAIGHQDCSFTGDDRDVQALCGFVNVDVPVRKKGTKVVGLIDKTWVAGSINVTASGILPEPTIIPYEKGADAFYKQIVYLQTTESATRSLVSGLCEDLFKFNKAEVVIPILGWMFASPIKPIIMEETGAFPILFLHGTQGGGKSSTVSLFMRLHGYKDAVPKQCSLRPFPLVKLLSSTNAIPVALDEFKVADIKEDIVLNLLRTLREAYNGEVESKGHQDQTVQDYKLDAPIVFAGEWSINQPAIKERIILVRFSDAMKKNDEMRNAYQRLTRLELESFIPDYVRFCLNQDIVAMYYSAKDYVETHFKGKTVAPRIIHNLSVMVLGLDLFKGYVESLSLSIPVIDLPTILNNQLEEITGNKTGFVKSAVDQLIEELGAMAQKNEKEQNPNSTYTPTVIDVPWFKKAKVNNGDVLAINFTRIFPEFKEHCRRTKYEGDLLDKESYLKLFDECSYIVDKQHPVKYGSIKTAARSLCIDICKAKQAGIDLDGFGIN